MDVKATARQRMPQSMLILSGGFLVMVLALCALAPPGRAAAKALLLLPHLLPDFPIRPLELISPAPIEEKVALTSGSATLYRPDDGQKHPAVILVLGLNPYFEDPRLVSLVDGLARSGMVVLIADPVGFRSFRLSDADIDYLVEAFEYLESRPLVESQKIGYAGISMGASLALVASAQENIAPRVAFVNSFGGYYDARGLVAAVSTHAVEENGERISWEPHPDITNYLRLLFTESLDNEQDRQVLYTLWYGSEGADLSRLSAEGRAIYDLLTNRHPGLVDQLFDRLPQKTQEGLRTLSPRTWIDQIKAPVFIMHDRGDTYIPVTESRKLTGELENAYYTEFSLFQHVVPQTPQDFLSFFNEALKLWQHLYMLFLLVS